MDELRASRAPAAPSPEEFAPAAVTPPPVREMVLDGRRYRLVPIDDDADTTPPPACAPPPPQPLRPTPTRPDGPVEELTAREAQIVMLVAEGLVNKQIGCHLGISEWTVSTHLRRIFAKLDVDTRAAMVRKCFDTAPRIVRAARSANS